VPQNAAAKRATTRPAEPKQAAPTRAMLDLQAAAGNRAVLAALARAVNAPPALTAQRQVAPATAPPAAGAPQGSPMSPPSTLGAEIDPTTQTLTAAQARGFSDEQLTRLIGVAERAVAQPASMMTADGILRNAQVLWGERNRRRPGADTIPAGGEAFKKSGLVSWQGSPELRLRTYPDTKDQTNLITTLPFNAHLQVVKRFPGDWYFVSAPDGSMGYAGSQYIRTDAPEPLAQLHKVEAGVPGTAIAIAEKYYGGKAANWGQDLRFYVNVLAWVNRIPVPDTTDGWRQVHFKAGQTIWVPSQPFAWSLKGVVNSGSLSYNAADALGVAGAIERIGELLEDFSRAIDKSGQYMGKAIEKHVEEMLWQALQGLALTLAVAAGLLAVTTAIGAGLGALAGGVGAAPGAAAGFEVGMALLEWLGLGMLIVWVGQSIVQVGGAFASFLGKVWNARGDNEKVDLAAMQFAEAVALLIAKLLEALIMYVTAIGLPKAMKSMRGTKLGTAIGESKMAQWVQTRQANVASGQSKLPSPEVFFKGPRTPTATDVPAQVAIADNFNAFASLPQSRLPANLPPGHFWAPRDGGGWRMMRTADAPGTPLELVVYSDGVNVNYALRNNGRTIASDTITRQGTTYSGDRLPESLTDTGANNPFRDQSGGRPWDKGHGTDYADTLEGPGVRNSSLDPVNYTPQASWWNQGPRNSLVQRIRGSGGGYRELPLYDATPALTANGTPIPREFVFVETNPAGVPQRAWRIPNDRSLTNRTVANVAQYEIPLGQVPQAVLRPAASVAPDPGGDAIMYLPGVIFGSRGDEESE
jgi:hypothetical protein